MVVGGPAATGPAAMAAAVARLAELGGGQVVVDADGRVVAEMALPIGGLMSDRPAAEVARGLEALVAAAPGPGGRPWPPRSCSCRSSASRSSPTSG